MILGKRVALIEKDRLGGTCPNRGCVPSKLLIGFAEAARRVREADRHFIEAKIDRTLDQGIRATLFEVSTAIIKDTPAKSGRARGNWQASIGRGATGEVSVGSVRSGEAKAIADVDQTVSVAVGDLYYLTNNLPYIERLEFGYSKQAPNGMVRKNMQNFNRLLVKNIKAASN